MKFLEDKNQKDLHDIHQKYSQWINPQNNNNSNSNNNQRQPNANANVNANELPPQMQQMRAVGIHQNTQKAMELRHNLNQKVNELLLE